MSKRRTPKEWEKICGDFLIGSMGRKEFCHQNNLCYKTLSSKLNKPKEKEPAIKFLPIADTACQMDVNKQLSIHLPNGVHIKTAVALEEIKNLIVGLLVCK